MTHRYLIGFTVSSFAFVTNAFALDAPSVALVDQGFGKAMLNVTAGPSGAPNGFTIWWMDAADYAVTGWLYEPTAAQGVGAFTGIPTLNTYAGSVTSFVLQPNETVTIEIGDLEDETGVWSNAEAELDPGRSYVFCASANDDSGGWYPESPYSENENAFTLGAPDCVQTWNYWREHPEQWQVTSLTLGTVSYDQTELLSILFESGRGNGLLSLAHQLIATELNLANGADPGAIMPYVTNAEALIGGLIIPPVGSGHIDPATTSTTAQFLDIYNHGMAGASHCPPVSVEDTTWGVLKALYR